MKRWILSLVNLVLVLAGTTVVMVGFHSVMEYPTRKVAKSEILAAIERMRSVSDFDNVDALLKACESGASDLRIDCRLGDYDIAYRGHRVKASLIVVGYYSPAHNFHEGDSPYMTATAQIDYRAKQVRVTGS